MCNTAKRFVINSLRNFNVLIFSWIMKHKQKVDNFLALLQLDRLMKIGRKRVNPIAVIALLFVCEKMKVPMVVRHKVNEERKIISLQFVN